MPSSPKLERMSLASWRTLLLLNPGGVAGREVVQHVVASSTRSEE